MGRTRKRRERRERNREVEVARMTQPINNMPIYEVLSSDDVEKINDASMTILEEIGIDFYDDELLALLKENGAEVDGITVRMKRAMIDEWVAKAPSKFTQLARNPANNVEIGGNRMCFAPVYGPPFVYDLDRGRREATLKDFENFVKLAYMSPWLHHSGGTTVEPSDEPTHTRHLDMLYAHIKYSDKAFMGSVTSAENAEDSVRMCEMLFGAEAIRENPAMVSLINISSPRRLDDRMLGALKVYSKARQAMIISPFILSGAMSPVSVAGTVAQLNAESLAGITMTQMIEPGCPVIYGAFQTNIDLQSGAPVFGSAESQLTLYASAQLARRHNLPFRSGGMFASSKIGDAQAAYESIMTMQATLLAGVNFTLHSAGWLEGGLAAGYEKFVMDCEMLGMMHRFYEGVPVTEESLAMESQRTVPAGGHHLGSDHTIKNFRSAFFRSELWDYNSAEQWIEEGKRDAQTVANAKYKQMLRDYKAPELDSAIDEALQSFITKRKSEIPPEF